MWVLQAQPLNFCGSYIFLFEPIEHKVNDIGVMVVDLPAKETWGRSFRISFMMSRIDLHRLDMGRFVLVSEKLA